MSNTTCEVDGCDRRRVYRLYCNGHYRRWKRNGDPGHADLRSTSSEPSTCGFDGCGRSRRTGGLCAAHYLQKFHGKPLKPIQQRSDTTARDDQGRKQCSACSQWLALSSFYNNAGTKDGMATKCIDCARSYALHRGYGISGHEYREMLARQEGVCAICGGVNSDGRQLFVDHDHGTSEVRGLLCNLCNRGIGNLRDSVDLLEAAIRYLKEHGARSRKRESSV